MLTKRGINPDKSSSSRPCFLHFYDLLLGFYKTGCHLKLNDIFNIGQLPEITIFDPWIQK